MINWLINLPVDGGTVEYKFSYLIEQEHTPTVKFEDDQIFIYSPNNVTITLTDENVILDLDSKTKMNFNPDGGFIEGDANGKEDEILKVNFFTSVRKDEEVILDYKHMTGEAKILGNGQILTRVSIGLDPDNDIKKTSTKSSLRFSVLYQDDEEPDLEFDVVDEPIDREFIFRPDDHIVRQALLFHPSFFTDSDEKGYGFQIQTQKHLERKFPDKDQASVVVFKDIAHLNPISTIKDFKVPLTNELSNVKKSIDCDSIIERKVNGGQVLGYSCYFISKEADLKQYLLDYYDDINLRITIIIDDCLRKTADQEAARHMKAKVNCEKVKDYREDLLRRQQRQAIYQGMLFTKTFPEYNSFKDAKMDIRSFNVCKVVDEIKTKTEKIYKVKF